MAQVMECLPSKHEAFLKSQKKKKRQEALSSSTSKENKV
jgi:hypothetical protein